MASARSGDVVPRRFISILDSIWSMGVNYDQHVVPVISRYRKFRQDEGADPEKDSAADLVSVFDRLGGAR